MAIKTWIATTDSTWGTAASWSPAAVPTAGDDVIFNSSASGQCSVDAGATCRSVVMTGFAGVFTGSSSIAVTGSNDGGINTGGSTFVCSAVGPTSNFTYNGALTFTVTNGSGFIYCNGKSFNGPINFSSTTGYWAMLDVFTTTSSITHNAGFLYFSQDSYIGSISTSNANVRTFQVDGSLYLTGSGTLINSGVSTNLSWNSFGIYIIGSQTLARTLTFNTVVYPGNGYVELGGTGSGSITLAAGTTGDPKVNVTNTGGAVVSFSTSTINELVFSGGTNVVWSNAASQTLTIDGNLTLVSTMGTPTLTPSFIFKGIGSSNLYTSIITLAGKSLVTGTVTLNDSSWSAGSGIFTFVDAFTCNAAVTITSCASTNINVNFNLTLVTNTLTLTAGTLNVNNGANVTCGLFVSSVANTRILNMGWGTWTLTGTGTIWNMNATSITFDAGQSRIVMTNISATACTFAGGGLTYYTVELAKGSSTAITTISGNNTFANFIDNTSTAAHTISILGQTTQSFYRFNVRGTAGALVNINRSGSGTTTLTKVGKGIVCYCDYITLGTLTGTPASTWYIGANSSIGTSTGFIATAAPSSQSLLGGGGVG